MPWTAHHTFHVAPGYQPLMREIGLDAEAVWSHPNIKVWRSITERENATLDATRPDSSPIRLHIKRFHPTKQKTTPADQEAQGIRLLQQANIPTVPLVAWGHLTDGRSFLITEDLAGYRPADQLGANLEQALPALAQLAAKLHAANLHHRDLYLCHFFVNEQNEVRLIDAGRVKQLPGRPFRWRWIVKDLAQAAYSMLEKGWPMEFQRRFLECYSPDQTPALQRAVDRKVRRIARHDHNLRASQPGRNVSIPK